MTSLPSRLTLTSKVIVSINAPWPLKMSTDTPTQLSLVVVDQSSSAIPMTPSFHLSRRRKLRFPRPSTVSKAYSTSSLSSSSHTGLLWAKGSTLISLETWPNLSRWSRWPKDGFDRFEANSTGHPRLKPFFGSLTVVLFKGVRKAWNGRIAYGHD